MRVLAVTHAYPQRSSRAHGVFIHRLNLGLRELGHEVHVLQLAEWCPPWPLAAVDSSWRRSHAVRDEMLDELDGIQVHHPLTITPRPSRFFSGDQWEREVRTLARYCLRRPRLAQADVVIGHFMVPDGYHALGLARALGLPSAAMAWGDDLHAWPASRVVWRQRLGVVLRGVDIPIACSRRMANDGNVWLEEPRRDWEVVYGGVDLELFRLADSRDAKRRDLIAGVPAAQSAKLLLMLSQPVRAKGYVEMLDAWVQVRDEAREWRLLMAGGGAGDLDVEREIADRGLGNSAHWLGPQPPERIPELLQACDAFVLPSHNEGLSLSMLEAMATGLPVIATDVGGHAEVITSPAEGWLIAPRDTAALVRALREMTAAPIVQLNEMGLAARRAAARIGSPLDNAGRLAAALQRGSPSKTHGPVLEKMASRVAPGDIRHADIAR